jgi:hypothetical protein
MSYGLSCEDVTTCIKLSNAYRVTLEIEIEKSILDHIFYLEMNLVVSSGIQAI